MRKTLIASAIIALGSQANAQMKDISVTLQPTASYNWFDKSTIIEDGVMVGGRIGFGFGEAMEIRGIYEKSLDLKNTVEDLTDQADIIDRFSNRDVEIERIGGEFKANIPTRGAFVPYITLGSGVQKLKADVINSDNVVEQVKSEQIYANLGLGTMVSLGDRIKLSLEAKNTIFNMNPANVLFVEGASQGSVSEILNDDKETRMYNWSALAGLQIYLGGRRPGKSTKLDNAYYNKFSGGNGPKLVLEPGGAYINFDKESNLRNTYLLGGKAGIDLNQYIGLRGFYYQATENEEISTKWDKMSMYGGDITAKLNVARGIQPYLTIGGGYMNIYNDYVGEDETLSTDESGYFAKGGLGLNIPLTRAIEAYGSANLLFTSADKQEENVVNPDELRQHTMYNVGLRFQLGKRSNENDVLEDEINARVDERTRDLEDRIDTLEDELKVAYENNDTEKAVEIIEEKKELEAEKADIEEKVEAEVKEATETKVEIEKTTEAKTTTEESRIRMTPQELEDLVEKVIQGVDAEEVQPETTNERIDRLERLLLEVNSGANAGNITPIQQDLATSKILSKLDQLNAKIDNNTANINQIAQNNKGADKTVVVTGGTQPKIVSDSEANITPQEVKNNVNVITEENTNKEHKNDNGIATGFFVREGISIFGGAGMADDVAGVLGLRGHYSITNSPIEFMPDIYISLGEETGFGLNANAVYTFDKISNKAIVEPYAGVGLGYNKVGGEDSFGTNIIIGTSFNILNGKLYADYTARGFVDIHQVAVGYKLGF